MRRPCLTEAAARTPRLADAAGPQRQALEDKWSGDIDVIDKRYSSTGHSAMFA